MTDIKNILYSLLLGMMMVSCSSADDVVDDANDQQVAKQVDLLICVGNKASMPLQVSANTRSDDTFEGLEGLVAIPFNTTNGDPVKSSDVPLIDIVGSTEETSRVESHNNYYVNHCYFMTGTNRVLVYGGKLNALPTKRTTLDNIHFSLSSIRNTTDPHSQATDLATYMTNIANSNGWSTTENPTLKSYYLDFIHAGAEGAGLMSGSAAHIKAFVAALKKQLEDRSDAVSTAIKANIDKNASIESNTYPRSIGLPDGAAVLRWMKNEKTGEEEFSVRTTTTTLDNINGINRYTYPAELMFFTDSPIRTSAEEVSKITYQTTDLTWDAFLNTHYNNSRTVNTATKAIAVENPLQFGVANLQLTLTGMSAELKDAKDDKVTNADMEHLPLTGVIIGGQHTVGFNMKPQGEQTDVDSRFIYETGVVSGDAGKSINTLVLQSYDNEKVPVILEFENRTENVFTGKDGVVYPGTRFYLIGIVDPKGKGTGACAGRVFTQDYTTTMSMSVTSLAKAYTCMPDLLAPRLEVGVQIVTHWIQVTTTNVEL